MGDVNTLEITEEKLSDAIKQQFGNNKDFSITDNGDGSFLVSMNDTKRMYYVDETGEVIDQSKMLKISTADELKAFRDDVNSGNTYEGWYVYLANDITLDINEEWEPIGLYLMENSSPADETNKPFKGIFDGRGHEVNGIYINTTDKVQGLFGLVSGGTIKKLGIGENCSITGKISVAAIAGYLYNGSSAINCYNIGNITSSTTSKMIGGIVGYSHNSHLKKCYNEGTIKSDTNIISVAGGIVGSLTSKSLLEECFNNGEIQGDNIIGGILGQNLDAVIIRNCYNTGRVRGEIKIGGISGQNTAELYNCYNIGEIQGTIKVGGIVGENSISLSYYTSGVLKNTYSLENTCEAICGYNNSIIEDSSIKSEEEMKLLVSILGETFKEDTNNINNGYPILNWQ